LLSVIVLAQQPAAKSGIDMNNVDPAVRPQDDFYQSVNGRWLARTEIPSDKASYGAFVELADKAEMDLRVILEAASANTARPVGSVAQQVGDFYSSFMNDARAEQLGATPVRAELQKIAALSSLDAVAGEAGALSAINAGGPVNVGIDADAKDPAKEIAYFQQGGLALPDREYYLQDDPRFQEIRAKYQAFLEQVFTLAEWPNAAADAKAVLAFETSIAKLHWTQVESRDAVKTYNKVIFEDLPKEMPGFNWLAWARPQGLDRAVDIVVRQPSFLKSFSAMAPSTPLATWKAWLAAQYLTASAPYLSKPFVDASFEFFGKTISGQPVQRERWKRGVSVINANLGMAAGRLYVEKTFPPEAKARMQRMVANLLEAYRQSISSLDWMTPATKQQALDKLAKFGTKIGYPDKWRDYTGLVINKDDLLGNVQRAQKFENDYEVAKLGKPVDRTEWGMTPQTVNAYYTPLRNEIVFPAAILQPPFFDFVADDAVNYGAIGAVIGHEIGHGFDDQGRHYDGTGALHDWWTETDAKEFEKRAKMLVDQYNAASPLPGVHVNGELTLGENIGDLNGVSIAYKAYKISLAGKPSPTIDGLTGEQRLFAGWAQIWRSKYREAEARRRILVDPHSPPQFRVNIPVSNIPGFYDAYNVKPGDKMYRDPKDRVQIW
jgi:endothelin-converting enzyme/putative endopeptidase